MYFIYIMAAIDIEEFYNELIQIQTNILQETKDQTDIDNIYIRNRYHNIFCTFEYLHDFNEFYNICICIKSKCGVYSNSYTELLDLTDSGLFMQKYKNISEKCQSKIILFLNTCQSLFEDNLKPI